MAEKENNKDGELVKGTSSADTITNYGSSVTVNAGGGDDYVYNGDDKNLSISGGAGDDTIDNDWDGDSATIDPGKGNNKVYSYGSNVLFQYSGGNDYIYGFNSTSTLQIASGGIGKIVNSKGKALNFSIKMVDNFFNVESNTTVSGTANREILSNQGGKVIVLGNGGNDTLWGGDSKDVFIYKPDEGTDRIMDYTSGDMLTILKSNGSAGGSFTRSRFSDGTLMLNISGGGRVIFENVNAGDTVNINNKTYTISGNKLK